MEIKYRVENARSAFTSNHRYSFCLDGRLRDIKRYCWSTIVYGVGGRTLTVRTTHKLDVDVLLEANKTLLSLLFTVKRRKTVYPGRIVRNSKRHN